MKTWRAIATQRAVRDFSPRPIGAKRLERILEAGRRAPSSNNEQRWSFVVITDPDRLRALAGVGDWTQHLEGAAAAVAFVTPDSPTDWERESIAFDLGQCVQNMLLAAWELGIGGCHAAVYDPDATRRILAYPRDRRCDYLISLGYPASAPDVDRPRRSVRRRPMMELRHDETW